LLAAHPELRFSVSVTTRKPRAGEVDGSSYFFVTPERFREMVREGELLEWVEIYGNMYGTPRRWVEDTLAAGRDVLMDLEVQGGLRVKRCFPEAVLVFVVPPSLKEMERRLRERGTETEEELRRRMEEATQLLQYAARYDYLVVNDDLQRAVEVVSCIIEAERHRTERQDLSFLGRWGRKGGASG